eukprot:3541310-Pyramimonas_sp.AAC.1
MHGGQKSLLMPWHAHAKRPTVEVGGAHLFTRAEATRQRKMPGGKVADVPLSLNVWGSSGCLPLTE